MEGDHKSTIHFMVNKRQNHNVKGGNGGQSDTEVGRPARWGQRSVSAFPARHRFLTWTVVGPSSAENGGGPAADEQEGYRTKDKKFGWVGWCMFCGRRDTAGRRHLLPDERLGPKDDKKSNQFSLGLLSLSVPVKQVAVAVVDGSRVVGALHHRVCLRGE